MTWNYRIVEKRDASGEITQGIHEVFYSDGEPSHVTENPVEISWVVGENPGVVAKQLKEAFEKPVLYFEDFEDRIPF